MSAGWKLILWDGKDFFLQSVNRLNWLVWSQGIRFFSVFSYCYVVAGWWEWKNMQNLLRAKKMKTHSTQLSTETCNQQDAEWMNVTRTKTHNCKIKNSLLFMKRSAVVSTPFYQQCGFFVLPFFYSVCVCVCAPSTEFSFNFFLFCFIYVSRLFFFIIIYSNFSFATVFHAVELFILFFFSSVFV